MEFYGEGTRRAGAVPRIRRRLDLHRGAGQNETTDQQILARRRIVRPEIARRGREGRDLAPAQERAQRQAVTRQAVQLDPQLTGDQASGDGRPQARSGRRLARPHRGSHRRAGQAGDLTRGHVGRGFGAARGEGTDRAHAAAGTAFRAAILVA